MLANTTGFSFHREANFSFCPIYPQFLVIDGQMILMIFESRKTFENSKTFT